MLARKNPHLLHVVGESVGERMYRLPNGGTKNYLVTAVALVLLALVVLWLGIRGSPASVCPRL